jgi:fumarate reductase subunit D
MYKVKKALPYLAALATPLFAFAQQAFSIVSRIQQLVNQIIPILLIIGTIVFLWGVIMFLTAGADEEKRAGARSLMIYGLIGLFVMVAVWGIVNVLVGFFGVGGTGVPSSPGGLQGI